MIRRNNFYFSFGQCLYSKKKIVSLLKFINYLLLLPEGFEIQFNEEVHQLLKIEVMDEASRLHQRQREIFFQVWFGEKLEDYEQKWRNKIAKAKAQAQKAKAEAEAQAKARTIQAIENLLHETNFNAGKIADILGISKKEVLAVKKRVDKK